MRGWGPPPMRGILMCRNDKSLSQRSSGAAHRVALVFFVFVALGLWPAAWPDSRVPWLGSQAALAKMARDTVWLVTGGKEIPIEVEIAATAEESALGLMYRTELPENQGMLFPSLYPRELSMWMRNTFIPLDMVFIRADGVVHWIEAMTEPHSEAIISSNGLVLAVLELKGGAAARFGLKAGDVVKHATFAAAKR